MNIKTTTHLFLFLIAGSLSMAAATKPKSEWSTKPNCQAPAQPVQITIDGKTGWACLVLPPAPPSPPPGPPAPPVTIIEPGIAGPAGPPDQWYTHAAYSLTKIFDGSDIGHQPFETKQQPDGSYFIHSETDPHHVFGKAFGIPTTLPFQLTVAIQPEFGVDAAELIFGQMAPGSAVIVGVMDSFEPTFGWDRGGALGSVNLNGTQFLDQTPSFTFPQNEVLWVRFTAVAPDTLIISYSPSGLDGSWHMLTESTAVTGGAVAIAAQCASACGFYLKAVQN